MSIVAKLESFVRSKNKVYKVESFFLKRIIAGWTQLKMCGNLNNGINTKNRNQKIIISLTSYPTRFNTIIPTLKSLLNQTMKPDKIIVWLSCIRQELTKNMLELEEYGIEYRCNVIDLKSHKKYFFAFQEFASELVITLGGM